MREIKFRAWDKIHKLFIDSDNVVLNIESGELIFCDGSKLITEYSLQQFTGLKDKNGKEIFEGDIVRSGEEFGEVQYDEQQSSFIILFQPHNKKQKSGCANLASTFPSPSKEVIGNIYENPDLLK